MPTVKEYQELIATGCPWCDGGLILKQGKYGEFVACEEWCGYTKSVPGRSSYTPQKATRPKCPLNKCDGSGLLPFIKNGKVISNAFLHCECKIQAERREYYIESKLEDFDFPMSDSFRSWSYQHCGVPDPGYIPQYRLSGSVEPSVPVPTPLEPQEVSAWSKAQWGIVQQVQAKTKFLENKVNEHLDKKGEKEKLTGVIEI